MRKLFTLLLLLPLVFTACGDDKEDDITPPYFNPVEGSWVYTSPMGNTETRVFTKNFEASSISFFNGVKDTTNYGKYTMLYKIAEDTLWIWNKDGIQNLNRPYIKKK